MKNLNLKYFLFLLLGISGLCLYTLMYLKNIQQLNFWTITKLLPQVVSVDLIIVGVFSSFLWKLTIFKGWLVLFPNLNGTWKGSIQTTWIDPKANERPNPIPAILTIKQSFFKISCVMRTGEMTSRSVIADFTLNKDSQVKRLCYTYDSNPLATVKERSPQHYGTMVFEITEKPKRKLEGEYWTSRKTTGHIEMTFWKKQKLDSYPKEMDVHPVSEIRDNKS